MAGPWEKYAQPDSDGPWSKYSAPVAAPNDSGDAAQAALEHFGNAASLGYLPQLQATASQITPDPNASLDENLKAQGFNINQPKDTYVSDRDANIKRIAQEGQDYPLASAAGTVGGALATTLPMNFGAFGMRALAPINAASRFGRALQAAKGGAILGALSNPGDTEGQVAPGLQLGERAMNAGGGAVLSGGSQGALEGLSSVAKGALNLPQAMQGKAEERAFKAAGAMLKDYRQIAGQDRINEIGRYMLDNNLVKPGMSVKDIGEAADALQAQHGKEIGNILEKLDTQGAAAPSTEDFASEVDKMALPIKDMNTAKPTYNALQDVAADIRTMGKPAPIGTAASPSQLTGKGEEYLLDSEGNPIAQFINGKFVRAAKAGSADELTIPSNPNLGAGTFQKAQEIKDFVNKQIAATGGWKTLDPSEKNQALRQVYKMVSGKMEDYADQAAQQSGSPKLLQDYLENKSGYRNAGDVSKIANDQALRQNANRFFSPSDYLSGMGGALIGAATGGDTVGDKLKHAALGAGLGLAHKAVRTYGTPFVSSALDKVGGALAKTPISALGEATSPILNAAERSSAGTAVGTAMNGPSFTQAATRAVASSPPSKDPQISNYAKQHGLTYDMAESILRKRGYGQ